MKEIKVYASVKKYDDLEVRVRVVEADGERFLDIRDYIPSTEVYGRGVSMPYTVELVGGLIKGLGALE